MINWRITATTVYCDAVDDEVTLIVHKDGTARCTGLQKYTRQSRETVREIRNKSRKLGRQVACRGQTCTVAADYRDRLFAEESVGK
ncbi:MAG: hypothetical protein N3E40_00390 [Dehalococcoidia bacterium]|nr:hypothetical protein [Dehalococcoidia bacterium]